MALGYFDVHGVWRFGSDDPRAPFHDLLNVGQESVSTAIGTLKSRAAVLEAAAAKTAPSSPFLAATGWTIVSQSGVKKAGIAFVNIRFTRSGAAVTVPVDGNIANQIVATLAAGWAGAPGAGIPLVSSHTGPLAVGYIDGTGAGQVFLSAVTAGATIPTGAEFTLAGVYPLN